MLIYSFNKGNSNLNILNTQIKCTAFPHTFNRKCPEISNTPKTKFKSSELFNLLFYLCVPLFFNKIDNQHWIMLCNNVFAIRILYGPIQRTDIELAHEMLVIYHENLEEFYDKHAYTITMHLHLHLAKQVLEQGPLHGTTVFFFEVSHKFV